MTVMMVVVRDADDGGDDGNDSMVTGSLAAMKVTNVVMIVVKVHDGHSDGGYIVTCISRPSFASRTLSTIFVSIFHTLTKFHGLDKLIM